MILDSKYTEHQIYSQLSEYAEFYGSLSESIFQFITPGTKSIGNIDSYLFSSVQCTLESIKDILVKGHINDAYALLRKYYDSIIINIYTNIYLRDNHSIENFIVREIDNWRQGKSKLPKIREMLHYIIKSDKLNEINGLLHKKNKYIVIRERCNNHIHYNFYQHFILNDKNVILNHRIKYLDLLSQDLLDIFILHISYIFTINDHYMISTDYIDSLNCGLKPEENSQYWVAPFIQEIFTNVLKKNRPDIAEYIKTNTSMMLE